MPKLMRLNRLVGFPNAGTDAPDWIFQGDAGDWRIQ
jgi:hypothetical protein